MTNEERDALIESVRRRRAMASLAVHALLDALDEARGVNERWERVRALTDVARLDAEWQRLARERDEARTQLAALHAAASAVQTKARALPVSMTEIVHAEEWDDLDRVLADLATAAGEHDARVRAPVEAERDQLAAALAEVRDAASESIRESFWVGNDAPARAARERVIAVLAALPTDLAAQREARIRADERAKALREASGVALVTHNAERGNHPSWFACASAISRRLRAMADEAERAR